LTESATNNFYTQCLISCAEADETRYEINVLNTSRAVGHFKFLRSLTAWLANVKQNFVRVYHRLVKISEEEWVDINSKLWFVCLLLMLQVPMVGVASGPASSRPSSGPITQQSDSSAAMNELVELGSVWQRVHQDKWIVGLSVHNRTSRLVTFNVYHCLCHGLYSNDCDESA